MWTLWYSVNIAVKIKVDLIVWWNFWSKVDYTRSVYIDHDTRTQEWNDVSIDNLSRSAQDNHWKFLVEKKSNFDRFCKRSINIIVEDLNIETCRFESKQSISISQIWVKRNLQNETKELELDDYVDNHLEATHESETSDESVHWTCLHTKAKHSSWFRSTSSFSVNWEKEIRQYCHDRSRCVLNSSQE